MIQGGDPKNQRPRAGNRVGHGAIPRHKGQAECLVIARTFAGVFSMARSQDLIGRQPVLIVPRQPSVLVGNIPHSAADKARLLERLQPPTLRRIGPISGMGWKASNCRRGS